MSTGQGMESIHNGENIVLGGLYIQIVFFVCFIIVSLVFHIRLLRSSSVFARSSVVPWQKHQYALYINSVLILVRSVFRVIEYSQGRNGYLLSNEVFLYVFDAVLMLAVMVVFNVVYPGEVKACLKQKEREEVLCLSGDIPLQSGWRRQ